MPHPALACEIASTHVAVAHGSRTGAALDAHAVEALPEGAVQTSPVELNILDPGAVGGALRSAFSRVHAGPRGHGGEVALLVPDPVVRVFLLHFETFPRRADEAVPLLRALVAARPDEPVHHLYLGTALSRGLRFAEADAALARALALYPGYALAAQARAQNARAAALWRALPPEAPDEPAALRARRAQVYQWVGRLERAAALWTEVARAPDADAASLDAASRALAQQRQAVGDTPATRALARALQDRRG